MDKSQLENASTYYLILELLEGGAAGLISCGHAISEGDILGELRNRTGQDLGSRKEDWAQFFIESSDLGSELERANVLIYLRTQEAMARIWYRVNDIDRK